MTWLQERLVRLEAPPVRPGFREELWERIEERERSATRRWRASAIVAVAVAVAAASAAGVLAFGVASGATSPVDETVSCPIEIVGGVNKLVLGAIPRHKPIRVNGKLEPRPGGFWAQSGLTNTPVQLAFLTGLKDGVTLDHLVCTPAQRIPLARAGLPLLNVLNAFHGGTVSQECWVAPRITLRLHVIFGKTGAPIAAQMAIRSGAKRRPVAFFDWTLARIRAYVSQGFCRPGRFPGQ